MDYLEALEASIQKCPECGGVARICGEGRASQTLQGGHWLTHFIDRLIYRVVCQKCGKHTTYAYKDPERAADAWNKKIMERVPE